MCRSESVASGSINDGIRYISCVAYFSVDFHCWDKVISFQEREFFLNFLSSFLVDIVSDLSFQAKNTFHRGSSFASLLCVMQIQIIKLGQNAKTTGTNPRTSGTYTVEICPEARCNRSCQVVVKRTVYMHQTSPLGHCRYWTHCYSRGIEAVVCGQENRLWI